MSLCTVAQCPLQILLDQQKSEGIVCGSSLDGQDPDGHHALHRVWVKAVGA